MAKNPGYPPIRRVVTGHDGSDNPVVLLDGAATNEKYPDTDVVSTLIWSSDAMPVPVPLGAAEDMGARILGSAPPPNGTRFCVIDFPPGNPVARHRTETMDYVIVLEGEIDMYLDEEHAVHLAAGDILIQRATYHAWVNRGSQRARIAVVLVDAVPLGIGSAVPRGQTAASEHA
jgi:quercetin dioxygenase-like cupin family protein